MTKHSILGRWASIARSAQWHLAGDMSRAWLCFALFEEDEQAIQERKHTTQGYIFADYLLPPSWMTYKWILISKMRTYYKILSSLKCLKQLREETETQLSYVHVDSTHNGYIISVFRYRIVDFHIEQARTKLIKAWAWRHKNPMGCHCPCRTHFLFPAELLRACQEEMAISQLRATFLGWLVSIGPQADWNV